MFEDTYMILGDDGENPSFAVVVRQVNDRPVMRMTFKFEKREQALRAVRRMKQIHTQRIMDYVNVAETIVKPVILVCGSHEQRVSVPCSS